MPSGTGIVDVESMCVAFRWDKWTTNTKPNKKTTCHDGFMLKKCRKKLIFGKICVFSSPTSWGVPANCRFRGFRHRMASPIPVPVVEFATLQLFAGHMMVIAYWANFLRFLSIYQRIKRAHRHPGSWALNNWTWHPWQRNMGGGKPKRSYSAYYSWLSIFKPYIYIYNTRMYSCNLKLGMIIITLQSCLPGHRGHFSPPAAFVLLTWRQWRNSSLFECRKSSELKSATTYFFWWVFSSKK